MSCHQYTTMDLPHPGDQDQLPLPWCSLAINEHKMTGGSWGPLVKAYLLWEPEYLDLQYLGLLRQEVQLSQGSHRE